MKYKKANKVKKLSIALVIGLLANSTASADDKMTLTPDGTRQVSLANILGDHIATDTVWRAFCLDPSAENTNIQNLYVDYMLAREEAGSREDIFNPEPIINDNPNYTWLGLVKFYYLDIVVSGKRVYKNMLTHTDKYFEDEAVFVDKNQVMALDEIISYSFATMLHANLKRDCNQVRHRLDITQEALLLIKDNDDYGGVLALAYQEYINSDFGVQAHNSDIETYNWFVEQYSEKIEATLTKPEESITEAFFLRNLQLTTENMEAIADFLEASDPEFAEEDQANKVKVFKPQIVIGQPLESTQTRSTETSTKVENEFDEKEQLVKLISEYPRGYTSEELHILFDALHSRVDSVGQSILDAKKERFVIPSDDPNVCSKFGVVTNDQYTYAYVFAKELQKSFDKEKLDNQAITIYTAQILEKNPVELKKCLW